VALLKLEQRYKHNSCHDKFKDYPYKVAQEAEIYKELSTTRTLNTDVIIKRILANRQKYQAVYDRKKKKEDEYRANSVVWRGKLTEL
jgi:hypothetical protein